MKIIAAILLALSFSASAESTFLYTEVSQPGETMDAFVVRIAPQANKVTRKNGFELCGVIRLVDSVMQIDLHSGEKFKCAAPVVNQDQPIIYYHTHVLEFNQPLVFSEQDMKNAGYVSGRKDLLYTDGNGSVKWVN